jgi:DNA modification methylase
MIHTLRRGEIHHARAEQVYPTIDEGSVSLAIIDGPYNMRKAEWDKFPSWEAFQDYYRAHIEALDRIMAPSSTVYLWGSDESEGYLRQPMREAGWTFRGSIVWQKTGAHPARIGALNAGTWADTTERCGVYQRGGAYFKGDGTDLVWMSSPTQMEGRLWSPDMALDRVKGTPQRVGLHPCQKPLAFYERMIRASSRPGDLVLEPFGGTCRAAVAIERLPAAEARRYVCIEPDEDGRDYIAAVLRSLRFEPGDERDGQPSLFGGVS